MRPATFILIGKDDALAGLALLGTISANVVSAFDEPDYREAALLTLAVSRFMIPNKSTK
jgi:predicted benzoate:H+ symporter BenE